MKATAISRIGLVATVLALIVSLGSAQTYAAPALSPDAAGVAAPGEPKGGSNGNQGNSGDNGKSQGNSGSASGGQQGSGSNSGGNGSNAGGGSGSGSSSGGSQGSTDHSTYRNPTSPGNENSAGQGANAGPDTYTSPKGQSSQDPPAPSGNGQGNGQAQGRPATGTVGNADDKNPPGQVKNPELGGYECKNNGNGLGNPAHTQVAGCPTPTATEIQQPTAVPTQTVVEALPTPGPSASATPTPTSGVSPTATPTPKKNDDRGENNTEGQLSTGTAPLGGAVQLAPGQAGSGVAAGSAPGQAPEVLGQIASAPPQAALGQPGVQQEAALGASTAAADPALLPYTGDADGPSSLPAMWMAAGLLLGAAGLFVRRSALATADR